MPERLEGEKATSEISKATAHKRRNLGRPSFQVYLGLMPSTLLENSRRRLLDGHPRAPAAGGGGKDLDVVVYVQCRDDGQLKYQLRGLLAGLWRGPSGGHGALVRNRELGDVVSGWRWRLRPSSVLRLH